MADNETRVTVSAVFKETGLDRMSRNFSDLNRRVMDWTRGLKGWSQAAGPSRDDLQRQVQAGLEVERHQGRVERLKRMWHETGDKMDKAHDPKRIELFRSQQERLVRVMGEEQKIIEGLNRSSSEAGGRMAMGGLVRRGVRLGLGVMGLPMTLGAAARGGQEAYQQEMAVAGLAARTRELNRPMETFSDHVISLRRDIVAAGAEFGYAGREAIMLQDSLSQMAGGLLDMREVFGMSRGLGLQPQIAGQLLASSRRFGGAGAASDKETASAFSRSLRESGMLPRGGEMAQAIVQAMQTYSTRLPAVSPDTLMGIFTALSGQVGYGNDPETGRRRPGVGKLAPTLRGQGGMQVVQGLTAMMDDWSEAMVAVQNESLNKIMRSDPNAFGGTLKTLGLSRGEGMGEGRFALLSALKSAGVADSDGLRFAGATIKDITQGMSKGMQLAVLPQLIRGLSPQLAAALVQSGFIERLKEGKMSDTEFAAKVQAMTTGGEMQAPGLAFAHLGRAMGAHIAGGMENSFLRPAAPWASALGDMFSEGKVGLTDLPGMAVAGAGYGLGKAVMNPRSTFAPRRVATGLSWLGMGMMGASPFTGPAMPGVAMAGAATLAVGRGYEAFLDSKGGQGGKGLNIGGRLAIDVTVHSGTGGALELAQGLSGFIAQLIGRDVQKVMNGEPVGTQGARQRAAQAPAGSSPYGNGE